MLKDVEISPAIDKLGLDALENTPCILIDANITQ